MTTDKNSENELKLPPVQEVVDKVLLFSNPSVAQEYVDASRQYYDVTQVPPQRIELMDYQHRVPGIAQKIHNIGIQHEKNPDSVMNKKLRERIEQYIKDTPRDQVHFVLEGFNAPTPVPNEFQKGVESFKRQEGENDESWYRRLVAVMGEQGIGAYYALKNGYELDLHTEISQQGELEEFSRAGISAGDIATFNLAKELDIFKTTNEFSPDFQFSNDQLFGALSKLARMTGWRADQLEKAYRDTEQQKLFVQDALDEVNDIFRRETGVEIISKDYYPLYKYANELQDLRNRSSVMTTMFNVGNDARNKYIAQHVYELVKAGKSPLLTFGDSHTFAVDPAFQYIESYKESSS